MKSHSDRENLLVKYLALPETYQPAWGIDETFDKARRSSADRLVPIVEALKDLNPGKELVILDVGCAQGFFALGLKSRLEVLGRNVRVVGVDYLVDNVEFCRELARFQRLDVDFLHDRFDAKFFERHKMERVDAVLALNVLHHLRQLDGADTANAAVEAIREHADVLFCELAQAEEALDWVTDWHDSDQGLLGQYAFRRRLATFSTHLTDVPRPLYVCSDKYAWVSGDWFRFEQVQERSHEGVPEVFAGQRRFFFGSGVIIKEYQGEGAYGDFNREEMLAESKVLSVLKATSKHFPRVLAQADDGDRVWLVRESMPGVLLSQAMRAAKVSDVNQVVDELLQQLSIFESLGFHHSDLRCWNMLLTEEGLRLIDFGAMVEEASPLHRVALAAAMHELSVGDVGHEQLFYSALHPLSTYRSSWRPLVKYLLETCQQDFSYAHALDIFRGVCGSDKEKISCLRPDDGILGAVATEQLAIFGRLSEYATNLEKTAEQVRDAFDQEREQFRRAHAESREYADSLVKAKTEADNYSRSLESELHALQAESRQYADSLVRAKAEADNYNRSLESELHALQAESRRYADSLVRAKAEADNYNRSLESELHALQAESRQYADSLVRAKAEAESYNRSLESELDALQAESRQYADSLVRAKAQADSYNRSLESELDALQAESRQYADSLVRAKAEADDYSRSLENALREVRQIADEAVARSNELESRLRQMCRRFRILKIFWPDDVKI